MEITSFLKENTTIVCLDGNLDGQTAEYAQEKLVNYVLPNCSIVIDMAKCPYVSSAGLRVLLMTAKQLARIGGTGVFAGLSEEVMDVMEMTGFSSIFESYDSLDDAIKALRKE
jgi:anti-anti-sigma factor